MLNRLTCSIPWKRTGVKGCSCFYSLPAFFSLCILGVVLKHAYFTFAQLCSSGWTESHCVWFQSWPGGFGCSLAPLRQSLSGLLLPAHPVGLRSHHLWPVHRGGHKVQLSLPSESSYWYRLKRFLPSSYCNKEADLTDSGWSWITKTKRCSCLFFVFYLQLKEWRN